MAADPYTTGGGDSLWKKLSTEMILRGAGGEHQDAAADLDDEATMEQAIGVRKKTFTLSFY